MSDELRAAFDAMLATPPQTGDVAGEVHRRISRRQQRRTAIASGVAVAVVAAGGVGAYSWAANGPARDNAVETVTAIDPKLDLQVTADATVAVGAEERVTVVLSGTGERGEDYGWRVVWGDGGLDRVYGPADCKRSPTAPVRATRVFAHEYVEAGPRRIIVELTRCGAVQARAIARVTVQGGQ